MIIKCQCGMFFDDEFRMTTCPHDTFMANDGQNNFKHYTESWLADYEPSKERFAMVGAKSDYTKYQEWLKENQIKV